MDRPLRAIKLTMRKLGVVAVALLCGAALTPWRWARDEPGARQEIAEASERQAQPLRVHVTDERGEAVSPMACGIMRGLELVGRFEGNEGPRDLATSDGDRLFVFSPGHEVAVFTLKGGQTQVEGTLQDASAEAHFQLEGSVNVWATYIAFMEGPWAVPKGESFPRGPFNVRGRIEFDNGKAVIAVPQDARINVFPKSRGGIVWPVAVSARPGTVHTLQAEPHRCIDVVGVRFDEIRGMIMLPDRLVAPGGPPERVDAITEHVVGNGWALLSRRGTSAVVDGVPRAAFHAFLSTEGGWRYGHVAEDCGQVAVEWERRTESGEVVIIGGAAAPDGCMVFPGRLDLLSVVELLDRVGDAEDGPIATCEGARLRHSLPPSSSATAYEPSRGIAFLERSDGRMVGGNWEPGQITVTIASDELSGGFIRLWPEWEGSRSVLVAPQYERLVHRLKRGKELVVRGLPVGRYTVQFELSGAAGTTVRGVCVVSITRVDATVSLVLPARG